jgi:hypothetical protein
MNKNIIFIMLFFVFLLLFILKQLTNYNKLAHKKFKKNIYNKPHHVSNKFLTEIIEPFHK